LNLLTPLWRGTLLVRSDLPSRHSPRAPGARNRRYGPLPSL